MNTQYSFQIFFLSLLFPFSIYTADPEDAWTELQGHVVATHAIDGNTFSGLLDADPTAMERCDLDRPDAFVLQNVLTRNGTLGSHISVADVMLPFPTRPHIHWAWNQLVQPHGTTTWDNAFLCVLEPMTELNREGKLLGIAPYDSFSMGSHTLSSQSVILIREDLLQAARDHLQDFEGKIVSFSPEIPCRQAVIDTIKRQFPEVWHVTDSRGREVGGRATETGGGYRHTTNLRSNDGTVLQIIARDGARPRTADLAAMTEARRHHFVGLHMQAPTFALEDDPILIQLAQSPITPGTVESNPYCLTDAVDEKKVGELSVCRAADVYMQTKAVNNRVATEFLRRYLHKAIVCDYVSITGENPDENIAAIFNNPDDAALRYLEEHALSLHAAYAGRDAMPPFTRMAQALRNLKRGGTLTTSAIPEKLAEYQDALTIVNAGNKVPELTQDSRIRLAKGFVDRENYKDAISIYEEILASESNKGVVAEAKLGIAHLLRGGLGIKVDHGRVFSLFNEVYQQDENLEAKAEAAFWLARCFSTGYRGTINVQKAFEFFTYAANQDVNIPIKYKAQAELTVMWRYGLGCTVNVEHAQWLAENLTQSKDPQLRAVGYFQQGCDLEAKAHNIEGLNEARKAYIQAIEQSEPFLSYKGKENTQITMWAYIKLSQLFRCDIVARTGLEFDELVGVNLLDESQNCLMRVMQQPKPCDLLTKKIARYLLGRNIRQEKKLLYFLADLPVKFLGGRIARETDSIGLSHLKDKIIAILAKQLLTGRNLKKFERDPLYFDQLELTVDVESALVQYIKENRMGPYKVLVESCHELTLKQILFLSLCASYRIFVYQLGSRIGTFGSNWSRLDNSQQHLWSIFTSLPMEYQRILNELELVKYVQQGP